MIKIHKSKDGQWYFTVHASNGKVLTTSEMYKRKANCMNGTGALITVVANPAIKIEDTTI